MLREPLGRTPGPSNPGDTFLRPRLLIRRRCRWPSPPLGHERIEFRLVLREAQPFEERPGVLLLFLHAPQRLRLILTEPPVSGGRGRTTIRPTGPSLPATQGATILSKLLIHRAPATAETTH